MWVLAYQSVFLAGIGGEGQRVPIPPFSFEIGAAAILNLEMQSASARASWWQAGWLDQRVRDISLPTFEAHALSKRVPLGKSLFSLDQGLSSLIVIEPMPWILDLAVRGWISDFPVKDKTLDIRNAETLTINVYEG